MLELRYVVDHLKEVIEKLETRNGDFKYLLELDTLSDKRRSVIQAVETKKALRNEASKKIGQYKRDGLDPKEILDTVSTLGDQIKTLDDKLKNIENRIVELLEVTPNIPHESVPVGKDDSFNVEVRKWGTPRTFHFPIKDHVELAEKLDILDFERAAKITGARFVIDKGLGARLERSLIQFMMDLHATEHGYTEVIPPYIVSGKSMYATGQFPKFKEDAFGLNNNEDWYLNPTAEVPTINMYRDEIIEQDQLPLKFVSYTTAFRSEAGSAGRDTRGILRQHQFHKVELIQFTKPEDSYDTLESMLSASEKVLQLLGLPYRVVALSTGDLGFGMAKTYDIEVWIPAQNTYREIGSISNAEDFQARRGNIRFRKDRMAKTEYVHTLNGSGLAVGRTMIAILEYYQNQDGTITVPEVLRPYMKTSVIK